ncbi:uncharacterized protein BBA_04791 [Beauveria bassiana ARSEF 2860]|uniref:F-box domain-containing protein n=1 Tax=Beauveria bassiana (strain ARSEF 2860) TaxID=655819 RepID=J5JLX1_BEAB2|nr:uncharacterized protein BBA_04791 [Beauveria bassiana ARSEF 2860]EJP66298.1 hypothetical protein BBA_04791 [Beauveria bassiana ARSEF 2860]
MNTLPVEIFIEILSHLPPASFKSARLTSRQFNAVLAQPTFCTLRGFLDDADAAMVTLLQTLHDLPGRPRAMWSPHCSVPAGLPLPPSFLRAVYAALGGAAGPRMKRRKRRRSGGSGRRLELTDSSDEGSSDEWDMTSPSILEGQEQGEEEEEEEEEEEVSTAVVLQRLGRPEVNEDTLRQALFRYALHKSYVYDGEGEAPQLWVMNSTKWKYQL